MESSVEEIKKKIDIVTLIGSHISLKKTGRNFKALCPFHTEKTASFVVSPERQLWHCFGSCGEGGDVIKFLMKLEGITFFEALKDLANKAGISLNKLDFEDKDWRRKQKLLQINTLAGEYFEYLLHSTKFGVDAKKYLESRKINPQVIKKFQIGYAPSSWSSLLLFLQKKKFQLPEIYESGLIVKNNRGNHYDRFRGRLMFPIKDVRGNIIGFSGRILDEGSAEAKYVNTPETYIYHKRETLYGIDLAKEAIKKQGNVLLVEGEFDVISPYQHGIEYVVAIKGSAVTKEQLMLLKRFTSRLTLAFDTDSAGEEAIKRGITEIEELELDVSVIKFENAKDPDEAVNANLLLFKKALESSIPIYDFIIQSLLRKYPEKGVYDKKRIGLEMGPLLLKIKNPIVHSHYSKKIAEILEVDEGSISELVKREGQKNKNKNISISTNSKIKTSERIELLQKYLVSLLFQNDDPYSLADKTFSLLETSDFTIPSLQKICEIFLKYKVDFSSEYKLNNFVSYLPYELRGIFDEVYLLGSSELGWNDMKVERLILEIKKYSLKKKISQLLSKDNNGLDDKEHKLLFLTNSLRDVEKKITAV